MMESYEEEMKALHDKRIAALSAAGAVELEMRYWMKRAECAARSLMSIADTERTNMVKGQMMICFETADEARRTLKALEDEAKSKRAGRTSDKPMAIAAV